MITAVGIGMAILTPNQIRRHTAGGRPSIWPSMKQH
jgi:hypothetical protein